MNVNKIWWVEKRRKTLEGQAELMTLFSSEEIHLLSFVKIYFSFFRKTNKRSSGVHFFSFYFSGGIFVFHFPDNDFIASAALTSPESISISAICYVSSSQGTELFNCACSKPQENDASLQIHRNAVVITFFGKNHG